MTQRHTRLQAAIVRRGEILLLEMLIDDGRRFWLLPGGGREPDDRNDAAAVVREVREEVGMHVTVERELLVSPAHVDDTTYKEYQTFLCRSADDEAPIAGRRDGIAQIAQVRWLPLDNLATSGPDIVDDRFLFPQLVAIRDALRGADRLAQCTWPPLAEPFAAALRAAVEFIFAEVDPVGIVATGTIVRGEGHANSDLDIYVVHTAPFRRRVQRFFDGVPTEIFINPPPAIRGYFVDEDRDGRRLTAHMLATGVVVYHSDPVVDELRTEAREWLARRSAMSDAERTHARYTIAARLEDALDVAGTDDVTATMLLTDAVTAMLEYACRAHDGQIPRRKDLVAVVGARTPELARLATAFFRAVTVAGRVEHARQLADRIVGAQGFFPWDSGPESVSLG